MKKAKLAVALLAAIMLVGCGSEEVKDSNVKVETESNQEKNETATEKPKDDDVEKDDDTEKEDAEKEINKVLFDDDDLKVTFVSFSEGSIFGPEVKLQLENSSDENVTFQVREVSINGYMIEPIFSEEVAAGKKANSAMTFFETDLAENGIDQINTIELSLHIFESDSYDTIEDTETIKIILNEAEDVKQEVQGETLLDKDGLKIINKGLEEDDFDDVELKLYIENGLKDSVTIQIRDCSINGFMIDPICSIDIEPGKKANDGIDFPSWELEENDLEEDDFETIEFTFHVFSKSKTIMDVPVKINLK